MPLSFRGELVSNSSSRCLLLALRIHVSAPYVAIGITKAQETRIFSFKSRYNFFQIERSDLKRAEESLASFDVFLAVICRCQYTSKVNKLVNPFDFHAPNNDFDVVGMTSLDVSWYFNHLGLADVYLHSTGISCVVDSVCSGLDLLYFSIRTINIIITCK